MSRLTRKLTRDDYQKYLNLNSTYNDAGNETSELLSFEKFMKIVPTDLKDGISKYTAFKKLGTLEDIEDELGIELETLFKAIKNGIYIKNGFDINAEKEFENLNEFQRIERFDFVNKTDTDIDFIADCWVFTYAYSNSDSWIGCYHCVRLKDYKKTWGLSKEELEEKK